MAGRRRWARASLAFVACAVALAPTTVHSAEDGPDLSDVRLELGDLPSGFRLVPEDQLEEAPGSTSAREVGEALERSLEQAELVKYLVYASESGDEMIDVVVVGPLIPAERVGLSREMADPEAVADDLSPSSSRDVDQSEPRFIDTTGIGEMSVGFAVDSRLTSETATVTNILGVPLTEATTQLVVAVRGDYVVVMVNQRIAGAAGGVDFLAAVRHVDAHLAAALGLAEPGVYRPGGTFSPGVANNIPTIGDISTEPDVVFANLLLAALAVVVLTIAMRFLNTTLVAHEDALEHLLLPARALGRWWSAADDALTRSAGRAAGVVRVGGVLLFYGTLFSFLESGWRPWTASGLFVLVVMTIAFGAVGTTDDMIELRSAHRWNLAAHLSVKPALVLFAVGSVALTKLAGLVPGLMIGTPEAFSLEDEVDERNELRLARVGLVTTAAVGVGAWLIAAPLDGMLDGGGGAAESMVAAIVTLLVLVFAVAVENLFANLLAFPGSEGATLRHHHRAVWWVCMLVVTGLFFHTLINPRGNLAESLESTNVRIVLGTVAGFLGFTAGVRLWFASRDRRAQRVATAVAPARVISAAPVVLAMPAISSVAPPPPPPPLVPPPQPPPPPNVPALARGFEATSFEFAKPARHGNPVFVVKLVVAAVVLFGLAALITVVVLQNNRDVDRFNTAHAAYLAGNCGLAVDEYDILLSNSRLLDTAAVEVQSARERDECTALMAIDRQVEVDPADALARYAAFAEAHPTTPLAGTVSLHVAAMLERADAPAVATEANCARLDSFQGLGVFGPEHLPLVQLWCAETYESAGRDADAYALAVVVLQADTGDDVLAGAKAVALRSPAACTDLDQLTTLSVLDGPPDELAMFLRDCMSTASAAEDMATLAELQIAFLSRLPEHADALVVEAALVGNDAACERLDEVRNDPAIARRADFIPNIMFTCAQSAEYVEDYATAIELYQWFVDHGPADARLVTARDGLARCLIARAQQSGAGELPPPTATGGSGSSIASVVIYNDSPEELRIVLSGPESRIEIMPASPTSSEYDLVGPLSCRTDVPMLELDVPAGDYQVLVESTSGGISPFTGTWNFTSGDAYSSCFFIVTTLL